MEPNETESACVITFPKQDVLLSWEAIESYARQNSLVINWDENAQVLSVRGAEVDHSKIIGDIAALIFHEENTSSHGTLVGVRVFNWELISIFCSLRASRTTKFRKFNEIGRRLFPSSQQI